MRAYMPRIKIFPFYLVAPDHFLAFRRCEVMPGVIIDRVSSKHRRLIDQAVSRWPRGIPSLSPNLLIILRQQKFESHLIRRLRSEGCNIDDELAKVPEDFRAHILLSAYSAELYAEVGDGVR